MGALNNIDFMFEIAFNKKLPSFYNRICHLNNDSPLLSNEQVKIPEISNNVCTISDVPSHLKVFENPLPPTIKIKKVTQYKGYSIDLNGCQTIEGYLKNQFGRSSHQALRSGKKRLETCFDISYKMYFGSIEKNEYDSLFIQFYKMLKLRAEEKGIENKNLPLWNLYTKKVYEMILKKEASLFVIYDGKTPINISLNMHLKDVIFLFITSYNIDYSKFRIGHTNWTWLIDWFIKNNIKLVDFSKGNKAYKKRWANKEYDFEYHLYYNKTSLKSRLKVKLLESKLKIKQILRDININDYYYATQDKLANKKNYQHIKKHEFVKIKQLPNNNELSEIDIQKEAQFDFLRPIIYQFLYLKSTNIKDITAYQATKNNNLFYVETKSKVLKLLVED